jgi:hypothetical protein
MRRLGNCVLFEVRVRQFAEYGKVDVVLGKALGVLPEAQPTQPVGNLPHHRLLKRSRCSPDEILGSRLRA